MPAAPRAATVSLLFRTTPAPEGALGVCAVAPNGAPFTAIFPAALRAQIKPHLDALWQAREKEGWLGKAPGPSADEVACSAMLSGRWERTTLTAPDGTTTAGLDFLVEAATWS